MPALTLSAWLRWDYIAPFLERHPEITSVLEYGCGAGAMGARLAVGRRYVGVEPDDASRARAIARVGSAGTIHETFAGDPAGFDLVCAFEVLEHIDDDEAALVDWVEQVTPGGWMMLSVPAGRHRYGPMDEMVGHFRRYDRDDLHARLTGVGLVDVKTLMTGMPIGYPLEFVRNVCARSANRRDNGVTVDDKTARSGRLLQPWSWAGWATQALMVPARLAQRPFAGSRFGTGLVATGRRSDR